ncbi:MAG: iron-containing redox enzyme family protein [Burkholderiaceae bacterium]
MQTTTLPFFIDLVTRSDEARRSFETNPKVLDIVGNGLSLERYRKFLLELYHIVWHFNPVCAAAASRIGDAHKAVRYFLYEHMHEEKGHEQWVMNDLEVVGVTEKEALAYQPSRLILGFVGYNYWAADRKHPLSVLGMLYALEVVASVYGGPMTAAIKESLLLEADRGISFVSSHAELDAQHMAELRIVLNGVHGDDAKHAIVESVCVNFDQFARILEAI